MRKRFIMMVATILLLILSLNVFANGEVYPLKSQYPDGVEATDMSLFSNSKIERPIETGFEKSSEIELLLNESQSDQFDVSEDSYSGKFALKIKKIDDEIIPVYETEYFKTGYEPLDETQEENIRTYNTKCNFYTLKLKPMSDSETVSFYVKVNKLNELGTLEENYALIKSDSDGDGAYSVGTDLSRGKWQTVQLNIADLDEEFQTGTASGLYMNANQGSQWLIDDITSDYRKTNETKFNLSEFASENVVYSQDALRFSQNKDDGDYNVNSKVVSGGVKVSEKISGIEIDSSLQYASSGNVQQEEAKEILYSVPFEEDNSIISNEGEEITYEKVEGRKERDVLPKIPNSNIMNISLNQETEKRFRLLLNNIGDYAAQIKIQQGGGELKTYSLGVSATICTDWYESDITITGVNIKLNQYIEIKAIEYETIEENPQRDILVSQGGGFGVNLGEFTSDDRTNLAYALSFENGGSGLELLLEFFEGDSLEPYYTTKTYASTIIGKQMFNNILPKIRLNTKLKITSTTASVLRFSGIEILKLSDSVWNKNIIYADYQLTEKVLNFTGDSSVYKRESAKNIYSEGEEYAVLYPDAKGIINIGTSYASVGVASSDISVYRILNLNEEPTQVLVGTDYGTNVDRGTSVYLHYGMADYVVAGKNQYLSLPPNQKVMFISKTSYYNYQINDTGSVQYSLVDGLEDGVFVQGGTAIIYSNVYDGGSAYKYDLETKTSQKLTSDELICSSPDETHLLLKDDNGTYYIMNILTNQREETPLTGTYKECFFSAKNELFAINESLSYYSAGELHALVSGITTSKKYSYDFDATGEYLLFTLERAATVFKNTGGIWNSVRGGNSTYIIEKSVLSNDISAAYLYDGMTSYLLDFNTKTSSTIMSGELMGLTDDNMLLINNGGYYYLYNPVTAERYKMFNSTFTCNSIMYNPETNMVSAILPGGGVIYHRFANEEPEARYALSFDGRDNWYAYTGGRWQTVSNKIIPTGEELRLAGMTASAVNSIPASAYEKLYNNNTDVLTVDVAIYMYSDSQKRTPAIENIVVKSVEKEDLDGLYGTHIEKYNKEDYRKITSLFPVENFGSNAECYYLFYIGNEWLYTYKDNEIVKVNYPANILLSDMSESWIKFKQYGMTAKELRRVPGDVLSQLFVNDEYANTEFGVIYVVKTKNEDTSKYVVNFHLSASSDFITNDDIVVELIMNGGDVKIINSTEFSATDIENLLSWIEARQSGNGEIFYRLKNENTQHFINYYMINSISVYDGEEYRANN